MDESHQQQNQPQGRKVHFIDCRLLRAFVSGSSKAHLKGGVLPAYCDPPNPCPKGYTAEDGCIEVEEFDNEAEFSRNYQAAQSCMCDSEHMFSCPEENSFSQVYSQSQVTSPLSPPAAAEINMMTLIAGWRLVSVWSLRAGQHQQSIPLWVEAPHSSQERSGLLTPGQGLELNCPNSQLQPPTVILPACL